MKAHLLVLVFVFGALTGTVATSKVYVDCNGGGDYVTIQEGIIAASRNDTVLVAAGTYSGPLNRDITFGGKDVYLVSEAGADFTIIDCESSGRGFVFTSGETPGAVVEGFTVTNGLAPPNDGDPTWGGALYCANSAPVILDCSFENSYAEFGGAMYCGGSSLMSVVSCNFEGNEALAYGGSIYCYGADVDIVKSRFTGNAAGISGGAVCCKTGTLIYLSDCEFIGNTAADGGAVYVGTFDSGGSEPGEEVPSTIYFCDFRHNTARRGGAVFINGFTWVNAAGCEFDYNTATLQGGAIFALTDYTRSMTVQTSTFCFNGAVHGGSIYSAGEYGFEMKITRSIFAFGTGGAAVQAEDSNSVDLDLCLAFGNVGGDHLLWGRRNLQVDPLFCDVSGGDYYLCDNSPCLAANNPYAFSLGAHTSPYTTCDACASPVQEMSWGSIKAMYR